MSEIYEEEQCDSVHQDKVEDDPAEIYKVRPPNKKKYEEEMEKLLGQIKEKEVEFERLSLGSLSGTNELQRKKAEKSAAIAKRKKIDQELEKLKKIIPDKMRQLGQLESSLIYKSEEKINTAVQRLEWNLKVQPFKLMEEKKIVSEIDRLKRSKKTLVQYAALKQDISGIRDMQRGMREERDTYFQAVGKLNADEERLRRDIISAKTTLSVLKSQIDELHESKRHLVASHKKQMEEFQGAKEKQRKGNWKKREDYKKSAVTERRQQLVDLETEKTVHDRYISWCNSLIKVLNRYNNLATQEPSLGSLSPASSVEEPELAEEIDDGQYVLLKKPDDGLENAAGTRRPSKKNRRPRKQSSVKKVTLSPDMVQQLTELGLKAPNSMSEVSEAIESLRLKKILLEQEQQASEVASDAGISATESLICEMSRQVSKTESFEGTVDTNPGDQVYAEILHGCLDEQNDQPEGWEAAGAVGGCEEILSPNSDSTVEGDTGSVESQSSVCDDSENTGLFVTRCEKVLSTEAPECQQRHGVVKSFGLPSAQSQISGMMSLNVACPILHRDASMENVASSYPHSDRSMENVVCSSPHSDRSMENANCSNSHRDRSMENVNCSNSHRDRSMENVNCSNSHRDRSMENVNCSNSHRDRSMENVNCSNSHRDRSMENVNCSNSHRDRSMENVNCSNPHSDRSMENVNCSNSHRDRSMENVNCSNSHRDGSLENVDFSSKPRHGEPSKEVVPAAEGAIQSLCPPVCSVSGHQVVPTTSSSDFPALTLKHASPPVKLTLTSNRSAWKLPVDPLRPVHHSDSVLPASPPVQPQATSAARSSASSIQAQNLALPAPQSLSGLTLDGGDFPSLSESLNRPRRGSNISTRSSGSSSAQTQQMSHPCDPQSGTHAVNQITGCSSTARTGTNPAQACTKTAVQVPQSCQRQIVPGSASAPVTPLTSQKCPEALPHSDRLLSMSQIPSMDMSSTEKWVESSVAYIKDLIPKQCMDDVPAAVTESTRL